jgi:hypothetical protein
MARTGRPHSEHQPHEHDPHEHESHEHHPKGGRNGGDKREESGDNPEKHARIIERRWLGSPPPTAELFANALRQWLALPGAVMQPASEVTPPETAPLPPREGTEP